MTTKQLTVIDTVRKMEGEFGKALPKHIPSDRFVRNAITVINQNPELLGSDIDMRSLQASIMNAAQDGLVLNNREAALVTFNSKSGKQVQYIPMVAGILKKMRNTGDIATISTGLVYQNEFDQGRFEYVKGDTEALKHEPILFGEKGNLIGVYAVVTLKDGSKVREFMDMAQVDKVRKVSRAGTSQYGPWAKWFEEMCVKSVLRKVSKLCPMTSDLDDVFGAEDAPMSEPDAKEPKAVKASPAKKQTAAAKAVKAKPKPEPAPEMDYLEAEIIEDESVEVNEDEISVEVNEDEIPA